MQAINVYQDTPIGVKSKEQFRMALAERDMRNLKGPALFLSRKRVRENLRALSSALPEVELHYAVKSNDHPALLTVILEAGHKFDVCSALEIHHCLEAGATTADLLHTHPIKSFSEIEQALKSGVRTFVIDNSDEIAKFRSPEFRALKRRFPGEIALIVRYRALDPSALSEIVQCNLSHKFGCAVSAIKELVTEIIDAGLTFGGLAFHVGSQCLSPEPYLTGINIASDIITALDAERITTPLLDIGGGFPVEYLEPIAPIGEFCAPICAALASLVPNNVRLVCEPGRYISASAVTALVNIIGRAERDGVTWYYADDGVYGSFSGRIYDHCAYRALTDRNSAWVPSVLAGPTCDSIDVIYDTILLPPLEVGDTLVFPSMGAYCAVSASGFNSLQQAQVIVVD